MCFLGYQISLVQVSPPCRMLAQWLLGVLEFRLFFAWGGGVGGLGGLFVLVWGVRA